MEKGKIDYIHQLLSELEGISGSLQIFGKNIRFAHSADLWNILSPYNLPLDATVKQLKEVLLLDLSLTSQQQQWKKAIHDHIFFSGVGRLSENKKKELDKRHYLSDLVQLCYTPEEYFVSLSKEYYKENKPFPFSSLVVDPDKIPVSTLHTLGISSLDPDAKNFKSLFEKFHPLKYTIESHHKLTNRIGFVDGKSLLFRKNTKLFKPEKQPFTAGEKRKSEISYTMNAYATGFDLLRSQEYTVAGQQESIGEYTQIQQEITSLLQTIVDDTKRFDTKRRVLQLIDQINQAKSFPIIASKVYNLQEICFQNKGTDTKHLEGAYNKFQKRIDELVGKVRYIDAQRHEIEQLLDEYTERYLVFYSGILLCLQQGHCPPDRLSSLFSSFFAKGEPFFNPFYSFYHQIKNIFDKPSYMISHDPSRFVLFAQILFRTQRMLLEQYQYQHYTALEKADQIHKPEFDMCLLEKFPDLVSFFPSQNIEDIDIDEIVALLKNI